MTFVYLFFENIYILIIVLLFVYLCIYFSIFLNPFFSIIWRTTLETRVLLCALMCLSSIVGAYRYIVARRGADEFLRRRDQRSRVKVKGQVAPPVDRS